MNMQYLKTFEERGEGSYPGPNIVNQASSILTAGGSDGFIGGGQGFGMSGAFGAEWGKSSGPASKPFPNKYKQNIPNPKTRESQKRLDSIKKLQSMRTSRMLDFEQDIKPKKSLKRFDEFEKDSQ